MRANHAFGIKHYAGDVVYDTEGIIEKNRDTLPQEGVDLLMSSNMPFTVLLGKIEANKTAVPAASASSSGERGYLPLSLHLWEGIGEGRFTTYGRCVLGERFRH